MPWRYDFFREVDGSSPVEAFLETLSDAEFGKVAQVLELLKTYGPTLPFPWSSQVRGKLRELRCHFGRKHIRILYYSDPGRLFILLHGLIKSTPALPRAAIALAEERMRRHEKRQVRS